MLNKIKEIFKKQENAENTNTENLSIELRMKSIENYFKRHSKTDNLFIAEYEAAQKINYIALKKEISENEIRAIVEIFNDVNLQSHYNGSAWFDFRLQIETLIVNNNLKCETLLNGNIDLKLEK